MRVMLDTNVFISMIFFPSDQTRELARRLTDEHQIIVCDYVIEELRLVTERKFPAKKIFLERFFTELPFELVYTPKTLDMDELLIIRDPEDSPILATAILENVDVLITGDKDFLVLDMEMPDIVNMTEFIERYGIKKLSSVSTKVGVADEFLYRVSVLRG